MGWSIGFDSTWGRDIGYGVPAVCDHPKCNEQIDRGLSYVCGGEAYGGDRGCGLFFCSAHLWIPGTRVRASQLCDRCYRSRPTQYKPKPDVAEWINHKLTDESWAQWRAENKDEVANLTALRQRGR